MAVRVALTKTALPGPYDYAGVAVTFEAAAANSVAITGATLVVNSVMAIATHGLVDGQVITISGFTDTWVGANGIKTVAVVDSGHITVGFDAHLLGAMSGSPVIAGGNKVTLTGKEIVLAKNEHVSDSFTVTLTSVADPYGRTKDISAISVVAGTIKAFGPFTNRAGWLQSEGSLFFEAEASSSILFGVLVLP